MTEQVGSPVRNFIVKCKGSSQPRVAAAHVIREGGRDDYVELRLTGGTSLSDNIDDYSAWADNVALEVVAITGKILTVKFP